MPFSDINEAIALTGTTYDSTTIESLRDAADEEIAEILEANNISIPIQTPGLIKRASVMWTCRNILVRQKHDGTTPDVVRAGNYYEDVSINDSIQMFHDKGLSALYRYINSITACPLIEVE